MKPLSDLATREAILLFLEACDLNEQVGSAIEGYCDRFAVTEAEREIFERFLSSTNQDNRSATLSALFGYGKFNGYEADALLLHYESRDQLGIEDHAAHGYLVELYERGSKVATRILTLLNRQAYVREMLGISKDEE